MFGRRAGSDLRLSVCNVSPDHAQVVAGRFERLFGIMVRNKPGVIIKGYIASPAETIKDDQQPSVFPVDARPHTVDDGDVAPGRLLARNPWLTMNPRKALSIAS